MSNRSHPRLAATRLLLSMLMAAWLLSPALRAQSAPGRPAGDAPAGSVASGRPPDQLRTLSGDELDIIKVLTAQERAWNAGDLERFAQGYKDAPDTWFVGSHISRGYAEMLDDYRHNYPTRDTMGQLSFADLEPRLLDAHFAVVLGHYHLDRTKKFGGPADGVFSLVFEKTEAGWKIIVDHTT